MTSQDIPSFHKINYSIRTNKNIERKLVFGALSRLSNILQIKDYRYIGFGSMWFVDFIYAHRLLDIASMWSIEDKSVERAEYNRPYNCIEIKRGSSKSVLQEVSDSEWARPIVAWLDYDSRFDPDVHADCNTLLTKAHVGSIIIVTVNANRSLYKTNTKRSYDVLMELFGNAVPADSEPKTIPDIEIEKFPTILAQSIETRMTNIVRTSARATDGELDKFLPLFALRHADGADMVTVGGIIAASKSLTGLEEFFDKKVDDLLTGGVCRTDILDLIPITTKEKLALDRLLPCDDDAFMSNYEASGLKLEMDQAKKYRQLYMYFPVFAETII